MRDGSIFPAEKYRGQDGEFYPIDKLPVAVAGERVVEIMPQPGEVDVIGVVSIVSEAAN